uniref:Uncharacterized protein n=1 Tax=Toxoplasma gondii (strain ATCC 50861 / VEG) TaxID=432359 RepID=A0A0F7UQQ8_TOXGV|nr:TPA: hypothetical protein BN1205_009780 [Toxoplasma gondii VEG]
MGKARTASAKACSAVSATSASKMRHLCGAFCYSFVGCVCVCTTPRPEEVVSGPPVRATPVLAFVLFFSCLCPLSWKRLCNAEQRRVLRSSERFCREVTTPAGSRDSYIKWRQIREVQPRSCHGNTTA